ncbi:MAG: 16S rRNA (cytidine(1402)-2'-O)-methyltransferase [Acidobacteriota bacterium]|nr:MAG: 16S rRNA (cytidine(1402)-2'-O)-methyltransferase [Acidobacteriota bacterium]
MTLRAIEALKSADVVACEDTRRTRKLLSRYDIHPKRLVSYHEHTEKRRSRELLKLLRSGQSVVLVSDAGTPCISDPGYRLVQEAVEAGVPVVPLPGASAILCALQASGLPTEPFVFLGFLPSKAAARKKFLTGFQQKAETLVCFESPHRILEALSDVEAVLGDRRAALARELTKVHEEILRGSVSSIRDILEGREKILGEITLVIEGAPKGARTASEEAPAALMERLLQAGMSGRDAARVVSDFFGIPRREAYRMAHQAGGGK